MKNWLLKIALFTLVFIFSHAQLYAKKYYIKFSGSDAANGLSITNAWQTISKVNATVFSAGDTVLFEGGSTFIGNIYFSPSSYGIPKKPILISSYGSGKATISAGNGNGVFGYNNGGIEVKNLIITGSGYASNNGVGVYFFMDKIKNAKIKHIEIENVEVSGFKTSGIQIGSWPSDSSRSGYDSVKITGCYAHDNGLSGISMYGYYKLSDTAYSHKNIWIRRCIAAHNDGILGMSTHSGSGIIIGQVDTCVMEYCEAYENGKNNNYAGGGPAGIWAWDSRSVVIQYCYAHHNRSQTGDGDGFDLDGGVQYSMMQYNYSHDNDGPGFLIAQFTGARKMKNIAVRYNISERDGKGLGALIWSGDPPSKVTAEKIDFYNNTIFIDTIGSGFANGAMAVYNTYGAMKDIRICNNIFVTKNNATIVDISKTLNLKFYNNAYYDYGNGYKFIDKGTTYSSLITWRGATGQEFYNGKNTGFKIDPGLMNIGGGKNISGVDSLKTIKAYRLSNSSALIGKGIIIDTLFGFNNLVTDFYGDTMVINNQYSLGAHEIEAPKAQFTSSNVCLGVSIRFINRSLKSLAYLWKFGDGASSSAFSPNYTYTSIGKYTVTLIAYGKFGYIDSLKKTIEIYETPKAIFNILNTSLCQKATIDFNNTSTGTATYLWTYGDSSKSTQINGSHVYKIAGSYAVKLLLVNAQNCRDSASTVLLVYPKPVAGFSSTGHCAKADITFKNNSIAASVYNWRLGDSTASIIKDPHHIYQYSGTKIIQLIVSSSNFCNDTILQTILIDSKPHASFSIQNHCLKDTLPLLNNSTTDSAYHWDFGDGNGSLIKTPVQIYNAIGDYNIQLRVVNKSLCSDTLEGKVRVNDLPSVIFSYKRFNDSFHFAANDTQLSNYLWTVDNVANTIHSSQLGFRFNKKGLHKIRLKAENSNGCSDTFLQIIDNSLNIQSTKVSWIENLQVQPNPFNEILKLQFESLQNGKGRIQLLDMHGKLVLDLKIEEVKSGSNVICLDLQNQTISSGIYQLVLVVNGASFSTKIVKQ